MEKTDVFRLAKPKRKGILPLIFSRFLIILVLLLLQVALMVGFYLWLNSYFRWFHIVLALFSLMMVLYLFNSSMDSSAKLSWMFLIALLPVPGAIFYWFTQSNVGNRKLSRRVDSMIERSRDMIRQDEETFEKLRTDGSGTDDLCTYLNRGGCFPVYENTEVIYFPSGEAKFSAMLEELKKAEKYIFMEYFIIEEGYMWGEILKILMEKAQAGVDVRVMYDGMCELSKLPADYLNRLREHGIKAKTFSPIRAFVSSHYNYRDHRKILVIDGKVAFNGGVNLADEYINRKELFGHWKDVALMMKGDAVRSFTLLFLQMWNIDEEEPAFVPFMDGVPVQTEHPSGYVMPYGDSPLDRDKAGETVYMDMLYRANSYVHIMTPYLILDGEMQTALQYAAQRGIDVKLILPGVPDKKLAYSLAKAHYRDLLGAGVKIYEYTPGFVHAKVFVSDGCKAVTGTINLDYRSLYHHFECASYLYKTDCIPDIEQDFQETLSRCREVTEETVKKEKGYRFFGGLLRFLAPLM